LTKIDITYYDFLAKLNLEGKKTVWNENRIKIDHVYKRIKKYLKNTSSACEVGVGDGYLLRLLHNSGLNVLGIDISKYLVNELKSRFDREGFDIELVHGDISRIQLEKDKFDVFLCLDVLEHILNIEKAIKNIKKALINGGLLIGTLPFRENLKDNMVMCPKCKYKFHRIGHYHSFNTVEDIKQLLGSDFKIVEISELRLFKNVFDIISHIIHNISWFIFKTNIASTVYFVARVNKN